MIASVILLELKREQKAEQRTGGQGRVGIWRGSQGGSNPYNAERIRELSLSDLRVMSRVHALTDSEPC